MPRSGAMPSFAGVRSPPLRGDGLSRVRWPNGGNPGWRAGGFLGGTHSVRPRCEAPRMPRHFIFAGRLTTSRWPGGGKVGVGVMPTLRACRARPSAGMGYPGSDGLTGETRDGAQVVFSEGRTLCVRVARPHECRGIPFAADGLRMSRWPKGGQHCGWRDAFLRGRAEPAPPRNQDPYKENQRLQRRRASVTRDAYIARVREPPPSPTWEGWTKNPLPNGDILW
jgi:hypothetical protein